jgi:flagellar biosynthesis protein FlhB
MNVVKLLVMSAVCSQIIDDEWPLLAANSSGHLSDRVTLMSHSIIHLASAIAITSLAWGAADYFIQRWRFERSLQMTKEELRQEAREVEGDPHIRHQRQAAARQFAMPRQHSDTR